MTSPFDFTKSFTKTKISLIDSEELFEKDYSPFMVNKIFSNSATTLPYAEAMNQYSFLDKKIQHDWYMHALPKSNSYTPYVKKQNMLNIDESLIQFVQNDADVSYKRAIEVIEILGEQFVKDLSDKRGGVSQNGKSRRKTTSSANAGSSDNI